MANKRLIGDDGKLVRASVAASPTTTTLTTGWYKLAVVAGGSFGTLAVDDYYYAPATVTLSGSDSAYAVTTAELQDLSGWSLGLTADEIEVTVLADTYKKYRKGKLDANGSASFVFTKGVTDADAGLAHYFFKEATISATGAVSNVLARSDDALLLIGYIDDETTSADYKLITAFEVEFYDFSLPMASSEAVNMEVPFRLSGDTDPILYKVYNP